MVLAAEQIYAHYAISKYGWEGFIPSEQIHGWSFQFFSLLCTCISLLAAQWKFSDENTRRTDRNISKLQYSGPNRITTYKHRQNSSQKLPAPAGSIPDPTAPKITLIGGDLSEMWLTEDFACKLWIFLFARAASTFLKTAVISPESCFLLQSHFFRLCVSMYISASGTNVTETIHVH